MMVTGCKSRPYHLSQADWAGQFLVVVPQELSEGLLNIIPPGECCLDVDS